MKARLPSVKKILIFLLILTNVLFLLHSRGTFNLQSDIVEKILSPNNNSTTKPETMKRPNTDLQKTLSFEPYGIDFCLSLNTLTGTKSFREDGLEPITLCTHTTAVYMKYVLEQVETYNGPISIAFLIDRTSQGSVAYLLNLYQCDKKFSEKISLHILFRRSPFSDNCPDVTVDLMPCNNFTRKYRQKYLNELIPPFGIYPINVARNIARRGAPSKLQIISDIEMIFSKNFATDVKEQANSIISENSNELIVIRRFELDSSIKTVPRTVKELKRLFDQKKIFEFHHKLFPAGHTIPGLFQWFRKSMESNSSMTWSIPYKSPSWEPQFIMHSSAPLSEERVPTRIRDHQFLAYELCRANYTFNIITKHFNVHRGIKRNSTHLDIAVRSHQMRLKKVFRNQFLKRINRMYPDTASQCDEFTM